MLIPYSRFPQLTFDPIFVLLLPSTLSKIFKLSDFHNFEIYKTEYFQKMVWDLSWIIWSALVSPKMNDIGLGNKDTPENPEIIEMKGFEGSPISKSKSYKFKYVVFKHIFSINLP